MRYAVEGWPDSIILTSGGPKLRGRDYDMEWCELDPGDWLKTEGYFVLGEHMEQDAMLAEAWHRHYPYRVSGPIEWDRKLDYAAFIAPKREVVRKGDGHCKNENLRFAAAVARSLGG